MLNKIKNNIHIVLFLSFLCILCFPSIVYANTPESTILNKNIDTSNNYSKQIKHLESHKLEETSNIINSVNISTMITNIREDIPTVIPYITEDEIELLARLVFAEAGNQDIIGKRYVVDIVLNRIGSETFPNTIEEVIYQKGQFSTASYLYSSRIQPTEEDYQIVLEELENIYNTEVIYFRTGYYHSYGTRLFKHGDHYFNKE